MTSLRALSRSPTIIVAITLTLIWAIALAAGWDENAVLDWIPDGVGWKVLVIVALLSADTLLPIPGTLVMIGSGSILGPVVGGFANVIGLLFAAWFGYLVGRLFPRDLASEPTHGHWGVFVAATRGLPLLSEAVAISAGVVEVDIRRFSLGALVGAVVVGPSYAVAGASVGESWMLALLVVIFAAASHLALTRLTRRGSSPSL